MTQPLQRKAQHHWHCHWNWMCKDMEMRTETTNVWVPAPFPYVCKGKGQTNSQIAEMMLIREYRSKPSLNSMLSSHIPTQPDGCICVHTDAIHVSVQDGVGWFTVCTQALCFSLSVGLWSISTRMTPCKEAPSSLLWCLENCDQNKSLWR